ncbi:hypothetical protein HZC00_04170 [Candidatus Kaiserbacteria bacterium]|nr:hypothetical protein [Candidatus Kaiserbacteria bacterium]
MTDVSLEEQILSKLTLSGSMSAGDLVDEIIVDLCGSRDFREFRKAEKQHSSKIRREIRRLMDSDCIQLGQGMKLERVEIS